MSDADLYVDQAKLAVCRDKELQERSGNKIDVLSAVKTDSGCDDATRMRLSKCRTKRRPAFRGPRASADPPRKAAGRQRLARNLPYIRFAEHDHRRSCGK